jgi:hypothetical protein
MVAMLLQALQDYPPQEWASLPDLQQKREAYYNALEAPNRTLIGPQQVRVPLMMELWGGVVGCAGWGLGGGVQGYGGACQAPVGSVGWVGG